VSRSFRLQFLFRDAVSSSHSRILQNIKSCIFFVLCGWELLKQQSCGLSEHLSGRPGPTKRFACPGGPDRSYFLSVRAARTGAQGLSGRPGQACDIALPLPLPLGLLHERLMQ